MKHLKSYNEELFWFKKNKNDLYIKSKGRWTKNSEFKSAIRYATKYVSEIDDIKHIKISSPSLEIFTSGGYFEPIRSSSTPSSNEKWVSFNSEFNKLREISDKLGYKVGSKVRSIEDDGIVFTIESIIPFVFHERISTYGSNDYVCVCTLCYKCVGTDNNALPGNFRTVTNYFQVSQIELTKDKPDTTEEEIRDNINDIDDLDNVDVSIVGTSDSYKMVISGDEFTVDDMVVISSTLKSMKNRLSEKGFQVKISKLHNVDDHQYITILINK